MNTFGNRLRISTFGESHGRGIGCVIDGIPAGLAIDEAFMREEMCLRQGGRTLYATQRKEPDEIAILSGVFEGKSTLALSPRERRRRTNADNIIPLAMEVFEMLDEYDFSGARKTPTQKS